MKARLLSVLVAFLAIGLDASAKTTLHLDRIRLPKGFQIAVFADSVPGARSMALSPSGTLFVGTRTEGKVYAIPGAAKGPSQPKVVTIAQGLNSPNGVAFRDGALYVAEISRILRYDGIEDKLGAGQNLKPTVVNDSYPSDEHHGWKYLAFGPDGKLYAQIGAPCNACEPPNERYATITRINPDGTGFQIYARGVRMSVGFDWHPVTHELWFTDNGRDWLGDNLPPDELNRAPKPGMDFGFPYCYGHQVPDPEYGKKKDCSKTVPTVQDLPAHVASLGMKFYTGKMFPEEYRNQVFIAEHGSWNRSVPIGYRVSLVRLKGDQAIEYKPFAEGWLGPGKAYWGRPVDVLTLPDGSLLVSDDFAGVIYRITYRAD